MNLSRSLLFFHFRNPQAKLKYNEEEKENFIRVMAEKLEKLEGNRSILNNIFLEIYANPVKNSIEHNYSSPVCE